MAWSERSKRPAFPEARVLLHPRHEIEPQKEPPRPLDADGVAFGLSTRSCREPWLRPQQGLGSLSFRIGALAGSGMLLFVCRSC